MRNRLVRAVLPMCIGVCLIASCSATPAPQSAQPQGTGLINDPILGVADTTRCMIPAMIDLWHHRVDTPAEDYPLGPGDEITISVPEIDELQNQHVRVAQDGTISLPLIGTVVVGGLDEDQARAAISQQLSRFMKEPRLEMYVDRYRSRGVAVAGAVQKPGIFDLATFGDSLNDMLAMAGGPTPGAAQGAIFFPAGMTQNPNVGAAAPTDAAASLPPATAVANEQHPAANSDMPASRVAIAIPFGRAGDEGCLNTPARPGDVILVATAGTVTVVGWVRNPGSFPIGPGMTVLGAVSAAGGAIFSWHAEVLRTDQNGSRVAKRFSLSDLQSGSETDIPIEAGDVVLVEKSVVGAVPYGVWELFERFGTGIGIGAAF